jgi:uncharacterized protein
MTGKAPKKHARPGVDGLGRTELHYAAVEKNVPLVHQLLAAGAEPDQADDNGWTALHFACQSGSESVVRTLLNADASVDPVDSYGNTPLWKAVFNSRGNGELIALLRAAGADPRRKNASGISPLSLARTIANYDIRQFFRDLPEDV